jgi:eukaryotic-like serine/threonine-protein kinase
VPHKDRDGLLHASTPLANGSMLGHYRVIERIGTGGMGEVYRACDTRLGRDVAIKLLPSTLASRPDLLARFEQEAKTVAQLNHPNIVVVYSIEEGAGTKFLTMELVDGQGLDQDIADGGLPLSHLLELSIALTEALAAAHERGVVHRDLKPANIMLTKDGRVKVLDFGLAKLSTELTGDDEITRAPAEALISHAGQVIGTVPYMAPEQWRGEQADARTDLFALGIIMYELATGKRPFTGASSADIGSAILRDTPSPLQSLRADAPADLQRVINRCLEKDRTMRFQTAKDVRNELRLIQRALDNGPLSTLTSQLHPASAQMDIPSIAVLPFVNRSRDEEDEYFSDGLADELLTMLTKIRGLRVAARTSSFSFRGKNEDLKVIGQKLNVTTLLEGSVQKAGNRVRIIVRLAKAADGFHLWSETYDRTLDDIFAVQDDIAHRVVKELRTTLMGEGSDSKASGEVRIAVEEAARGRGASSEAYRLYLQAKFFTDRHNPDDYAKGVAYIRQAVELDTRFALAWAELSRVLSLQAGIGSIPVAQGYAEARSAALRAIALEPDLAEGYLRLHAVQVEYDWDWMGADESLRRALTIAPANPKVLVSSVMIAATFGRLEEARKLAHMCIAQDPLNSSAHLQYARMCLHTGQLDEAEASCSKAIELAPSRVFLHLLMSLIYASQGKINNAQNAVNLEPELALRLTGLACIRHSAGDFAGSEQVLQQLIAEDSGTVTVQIAGVYAWRGENDAAFEWLERAYAEHDPGLGDIQADTLLKPLHGDPRWKPFLKKMRLIE